MGENKRDLEPQVEITRACGHRELEVERCAKTRAACLCLNCAHKTLPKPSACLREYISRFGDDFGPMLGPIGAVVYIRQRFYKFDGMVAWSDSKEMFDALDSEADWASPSTCARIFEEVKR